jgi:protocatechuate 3,4-dioxygenase beta subunit
MTKDPDLRPEARRRALLRALLAVPAAGVFRWGAGDAAALEATPACADADEPTPPQTAGPFFKAQSPRRASFMEKGEPRDFVLTGQVLTTACAPVAGALLDFWHTDGDGQYDMRGFRLRGHQYAGEKGAFRLESLLPGAYGGRIRHIHVRVQAPNGPLLTTQLYFPNERENEGDGLFDARLVMRPKKVISGLAFDFNFVLPG